jgi:hypothetical protein
MTGRSVWPKGCEPPSGPACRYKHDFTEDGSWCSASRQATESSRAVFPVTPQRDVRLERLMGC